MHKRILGIHALLLAAMAAGCTSTGGTMEGSAPGMGRMRMPMTASALELRENMRELWADHVVWTRSYIVSAVAGDGGAPAAESRLMRNQEDIGNAIVPIYGSAAGTRLTALLKDHIRIAGEVVGAAKAGDNAKLSDADRRWHANADEIATFLSGANPNWSRADLSAMLSEHLSLTTQEATARIKKDWEGDRLTFDKIFDQAMAMADALSDGIIRHHPEKLR